MLPSRAYMLALLAESLRVYEAALPGASYVQQLAWRFDCRLHVRNAWPYDATREVEWIISRAMLNVMDYQHGRELALEQALIIFDECREGLQKQWRHMDANVGQRMSYKR